MPRIDAVLTRAAAQAPDHAAIWEWNTGRRVSYAVLDAHVSAFAAWLIGQGVQRGEAIAIHLPNGAGFLTAQFASFRCGGMAAYVNFRLSAAEALRQIGLVNARVVVTTAEKAQALRDQAALKDVRFVLADGGGTALGTALSDIVASDATACPAEIPNEEETDALARFTSGSTGTPKGFIVSHRAWLIRAMSLLTEEIQVDPGSVTMLLGPVSHHAGLFVLPTFLRAGTLLLFDRFNPGDVGNALRTRGVTSTQMVPTMLGMMLDDPAARDALRVSEIKRIIYAGSPMQAHVIDDALDLLPHTQFIQGYGSHEAGSISVLDHAGHRDPLRRRSAGRPYLAATVRIDSRPGETSGEIMVNAPWTPRVRFNEHGRETVQEPWIGTGDIGAMRDGLIYLLDRADDVIISGGFNVYPREVETVIDSHSEVRASAVVSRPDAKWGERVVAFVVPRGPAFAPEALGDYCRAHLASYKIPREFHVVAEMPLNANGKPDRRRLSAPLWEGRERRIN